MDQTVLLCVDLVVVHQCEMVEVKSEGGEEVVMWEDQAMTNANET